ncbi:DUF4149 domain-containing protein [Geobacter sulfurreducens subsp. ethanolicus]|uniref:DUF4149 domain-containing protein n=1 Tax=Geomobilimonas luticola TaxID=1114878 RepID=A0ABS5SAX0_9BACT|nr:MULTISPECIES: DUF4149 domain-containing protein [Geobacteraceae]MBT0652496.1 DUF4149 domain-containing protein [Geomobilimonas luticola]BEH08992.1 DUF4149 domain-containing protein [Geobacter sulfurreducens subsp. ethanolicus]
MHYLSIIYRLVIAFWVGGAALFTFILTPIIFKSYDRDMAGAIVGALFPGYFRWGLVCGIVALICLALARVRFPKTSLVILVAMLIITALHTFVIEPKAASLKKDIPSFVTTPADHPLRQQFRKLHAISQAGNLAVIGGGIALIIML